EIKRITPSLWAPGLLVMAVAAVGWILGEAAGVALARHLALVMFLQGSVIALLGPHVARALLFPLSYALFLVPLGEELVPALQMITADISMVLLDWSGIPAHIEGVFISTPTGLFRVAEACSGVMFLIAMIAYGVLVANVCFKRWSRRIAFLGMAVIVPILANGVRAFGTIWIAHHYGLDFATGFDHIFYGWIFFALVMALVMAIGWRFFDRGLDDPFIEPALAARLAAQSAVVQANPRPVFAAMAMVMALPFGWAFMGIPAPATLPAGDPLPDVPGWTRAPYQPSRPWLPAAQGANSTDIASYTKDGERVDLFVALFDGQSEGREITGFGQGALDPDGDWQWVEGGAVAAQGKAEVITGLDRTVRDVVTYYRIGDLVTGSNLQVRIATLKARLLRQSQPALMLIVSAERNDRRSARQALDAFVTDAGGPQTLADTVLARD
uniref:exosortase A n=1 Tax=Blastomonas sp. TaxID=1909299 RepID=UPI003593EAD4